MPAKAGIQGQWHHNMKIVLASSNQGKIKELSELLSPLNFEISPQTEFNIPDADETGKTFVENAIIKARHAAKLSGLPAIADDSGLVIDALNGEPGIYSSRYAGVEQDNQKNIQKVLENLKDITDRRARFVCCLVMLKHENDPLPIICHGIWEGEILLERTGDKGFGYDPIFSAPEHDCSSAELSPQEKNKISHRGKALKCLQAKLTAHASS